MITFFKPVALDKLISSLPQVWLAYENRIFDLTKAVEIVFGNDIIIKFINGSVLTIQGDDTKVYGDYLIKYLGLSTQFDVVKIESVISPIDISPDAPVEKVIP